MAQIMAINLLVFRIIQFLLIANAVTILEARRRLSQNEGWRFGTKFLEENQIPQMPQMKTFL
jgi:hypothetical protein